MCENCTNKKEQEPYMIVLQSCECLCNQHLINKPYCSLNHITAPTLRVYTYHQCDPLHGTPWSGDFCHIIIISWCLKGLLYRWHHVATCRHLMYKISKKLLNAALTQSNSDVVYSTGPILCCDHTVHSLTSGIITDIASHRCVIMNCAQSHRFKLVKSTMITTVS